MERKVILGHKPFVRSKLIHIFGKKTWLKPRLSLGILLRPLLLFLLPQRFVKPVGQLGTFSTEEGKVWPPDSVNEGVLCLKGAAAAEGRGRRHAGGLSCGTDEVLTWQANEDLLDTLC